MDYEILKYLSVFAIMQAGIWFTYLYLKRNSDPTLRTFLIRISVLFFVFLVGQCLLVFGGNQIFYQIANLSNLSIFLALPVTYFYLRDSSAVRKVKKMADNTHYALFGVLVVFLSYMQVAEPDYNYSRIYTFLIGLFIVQFGVYTLMLFNRTKSIPKSDSRLQPKTTNLIWTTHLIYGFSALLFIKLACFVSWNILWDYELCIIISSLFFVFSFVGMNGVMLYALLQNSNVLPPLRYNGGTLDNDSSESYYETLIEELVTNKAYRNPLLDLNKLSKKLTIPSHTISRLINEKCGVNFNEFVNRHRIQDAQLLLKEHTESMNIIDIAYEVGFNSKSTFNTAFKKITGKTPSAYRKCDQ